MNDVVEAHATVLNWTGTLLSNHVERSKLELRGEEERVSWVRRFNLKGLHQSLNWWSLVTDEDPWGRNVALQFAPCYVIAQQHQRSALMNPHKGRRLILWASGWVALYFSTYITLTVFYYTEGHGKRLPAQHGEEMWVDAQRVYTVCYIYWSTLLNQCYGAMVRYNSACILWVSS